LLIFFIVHMDMPIPGEGLLYLPGNTVQFGKQFTETLFVDGSPFAGRFQRDQAQNSQLGGKRFGTGYSDFRPRMGVNAFMGSPWNGRSHYIADPEYNRAFLLGIFDGHQRIGGLAALRSEERRVWE